MSRTHALAACLLLGACTVGEGLDTLPQPGTSDAGPGSAGADAAPGGSGNATDAGPAEPTPLTVLADFGDCMSLADWEAQNLGQLALIETEADGNCATCHAGGTGGNYLALDSLQTFQNIKTYPYILKYAEVDPVTLALSASTAIADKQNVNGHPIFTLPAELAQGIINFFDLTNARYEAGACPPAQ